MPEYSLSMHGRACSPERTQSDGKKAKTNNSIWWNSSSQAKRVASNGFRNEKNVCVCVDLASWIESFGFFMRIKAEIHADARSKANRPKWNNENESFEMMFGRFTLVPFSSHHSRIQIFNFMWFHRRRCGIFRLFMRIIIYCALLRPILWNYDAKNVRKIAFRIFPASPRATLNAMEVRLIHFIIYRFVDSIAASFSRCECCAFIWLTVMDGQLRRFENRFIRLRNSIMRHFSIP